MLLSLTVRNFTLVEHLHTEFHSGMTAITGETGAGKSLVLDALGMALGDRGDTGRIRHGKDRLDITAVFSVQTNQQAAEWLRANDLEDGDECILRRTLTQEGRSKGFINGQPATMQQLQQLGEMMIDIHSQHEHQSLLQKDNHRRLLDAFARATPLADEVRDLYHQWHHCQQQVDTLKNNAEENEARKELISFQLEELTELALQPGELESLEKEQHLLANGQQILKDSHLVLGLCGEGEQGDARSLLSQAVNVLHAMAEKSERLQEATSLLDSALIQVEEASREIQHHIDSFEMNPERLQEVENRLSTAYQLARKHRINPEELLELQRNLEEELQQMTSGEGGLEGLTAKLAALETRLCHKEAELSAARQQTAQVFSDGVNQQLAELAMASASLQVNLTEEQGHTSHGRESIEFLISTNPGQPHKGLAKVASGGELSRISLAIQVIAARHTEIPTLVFDEVDVGVGGAVAAVVGKLLRQLGSKGQVICVTHLPQVASCAHHHMIASKQSAGNETESELVALAAKGRTEEIARMLGGAEITKQTLAHAKEMLSQSAS